MKPQSTNKEELQQRYRLGTVKSSVTVGVCVCVCVCVWGGGGGGGGGGAAGL